ncbi:uncharacterized protein [Clytia hemisphaerica]
MTVVANVFDFKNEKYDLYQTLLDQLLDTIFKVNNGHPLLRKTCSQCLILFQENFDDGLLEQMSTLLATAKGERSFASYDHSILLAFLINHITGLAQRSEIQLDEKLQAELNKSISFLIDQTRSLSVTGLLQLLVKLLPCLDQGRISRNLLNTIMQYSIQSWDVLLTYISIYSQMNYPSLLQSQQADDQIMTTLMKLTLSQNMDQNYDELISLIHYWIDGLFTNLPRTVNQSASFMMFSSLQPTIYDNMYKFPAKYQTIVNISERCSIEIPAEVQNSMLEMVLRHASSIQTNKDTSSFFLCLFHLYCHGSKKIKDQVIALIEEIGVKNVEVSANVADFCQSIEAHCEKGCSKAVWKAIMKRLLNFTLKEIAASLSFYLLYVQYVASIKEIWPMAIIQKLQGLVQSSLLDECSWENGSQLLSVCTEILLSNGQKAEIRYGVASILWEISQNFIDYNICDRAMFYYLTIGNVSHEYFSNILIPHSQDKNQNVNHLGEVAKAINSGLPFIKEVEESFLSFQMDDCNQTYVERVLPDIPEKSPAQIYHETLTKDGNFDKIIQKNFLLSYKDDLENKETVDDIFGIEVEIISEENHTSAENVSCPYLSKRKNTKPEGQRLAVCFTFEKPCAADFKTRITYIDRQNECSVCACQSFQLSFVDIIQPLPKLSTGQNIELFHQLWNDIINDQKSIENPTSMKALSVKVLHNSTQEQLLTLLQPFTLDDDQDSAFLKVGFYLPPQSTILMKFESSEMRTIARIAVDNYTLLDDLDRYLNKLANS